MVVRRACTPGIRQEKKNQKLSKIYLIAKTHEKAQVHCLTCYFTYCFRARAEFLELGFPKSTDSLNEVIRALESRWNKVIGRLNNKTKIFLKKQPGERRRSLSHVAFESLMDSPATVKEELSSSANECKQDLEKLMQTFETLSNEMKVIESQVCKAGEADSIIKGIDKCAERVANVKINAIQYPELNADLQAFAKKWQEILDFSVQLSNRSKSLKSEHPKQEDISSEKSKSRENSVSEQDEEVIDTLPEDNNSPIRRKLPAELDLSESEGGNKKNAEGEGVSTKQTSLLSSRESSPDVETCQNKQKEDDVILNSHTEEEIVTKTNEVIEEPQNVEVLSPAKASPEPEQVKKTAEVKNEAKKDEAPKIEMTLPEVALEVQAVEAVKSRSASREKDSNDANGLRTSSAKTSPSKTPPKTLPKPQWFSLDPEQNDHYRVPDLLPLANSIQGNLTEDELLARETSAIDRILQQTDSDLAEVHRTTGYFRKKSLNAQHQKDIKDFEESTESMHTKIENAKAKIAQFDKQKNLTLRQEFISMERSMIEAEAKTLISRGETLSLIIERYDVVQAEHLKARVGELKGAWKNLKATADEKIHASKKFEEDIKIFRKDVEEFKTWLRDVSSQVKRKKSNMNFSQLAHELRKRNIELGHLREKAIMYKKKELLGTQDIAV